MAKVRRANAYRQLERPYTRTSKFRAKSFIRAVPQRKVVRYCMGDLKRHDFPYRLYLRANDDLQIRHNAIESARMTSNRLLEKVIGKTGYKMIIRIFPHHILRENPLASGAGADRMSTGMKMSFGKPIGSAARVRVGQILFEIQTEKAHIETAKKALTRAKNKFPCSCTIEIVEPKVEKKKPAQKTEKKVEAKPEPKKEAAPVEEKPATPEPAKEEPKPEVAAE